MAVSARKRLNNDKYNAKCTQINLKPLTPEANAIKAAAAAAGQSLQGYILQAVRERMAKDGQPLTAVCRRGQILHLTAYRCSGKG